MKALFIGGPWDGRLVEHNLSSPTFHVAERPTPRVDFSPDQVPTFSPPRETTYVRVPWLGTDFMVEKGLYDRGMYVSRHQPLKIIMDLLTQGYRRPSDLYGDI